MKKLNKVTDKEEKKKQVKKLKSSAKENTSATLSVSGVKSTPSAQKNKDSVPVSIAEKTKDLLGDSKVIGVSVGVTKNLGDFESLRVDTWLSTPISIDSDEETIKEEMGNLQDICTDVIQAFIEEVVNK